jgi:membrane-bound inhibitor of C-type lysozyme
MVEPAKEEHSSPAPAPATDLAQHDSISGESTAIAFNSGAITNALSILVAAAQSSAEAATGSSYFDTGHIQSSHADPAIDDDSEPLASGHEPMTIALADGSSATVLFSDDSVVVAQNGLSASAAAGSEVTIGTHVFGAAIASDSEAIIVDSSATTHAVPRPEDELPAMRVTVDGRVITASRRGSDVVIVDGSRTLSAQAGNNPITLGPQVISVNAGASELVVGTSTIAIPHKVDDNTAAATAAWKADGSAFTAIMQGDAIVVYGSDTTITLQPGATATVGSEVLSIPASGGMLLYDGITVGFHKANPASRGDVTKLLPDGQTLTAFAVGEDSVVFMIHQSASSSSIITPAAGAQGEAHGATLGIANKSGEMAVVADGSETPSLPQPARSSTIAMISGGRPGGAAADSGASTSTVKASGASSTDDTTTGGVVSASQTGVGSGSGGGGRLQVSLGSIIFAACLVGCTELL